MTFDVDANADVTCKQPFRVKYDNVTGVSSDFISSHEIICSLKR